MEEVSVSQKTAHCNWNPFADGQMLVRSKPNERAHFPGVQIQRRSLEIHPPVIGLFVLGQIRHRCIDRRYDFVLVLRIAVLPMPLDQ